MKLKSGKTLSLNWGFTTHAMGSMLVGAADEVCPASGQKRNKNATRVGGIIGDGQLCWSQKVGHRVRNVSGQSDLLEVVCRHQKMP